MCNPERTAGQWTAERRKNHSVWPFDVPCVAQLAEEGMVFERPVTFLVGENGSGKSTLVEAFAEAWSLDAHGGRQDRQVIRQWHLSVHQWTEHLAKAGFGEVVAETIDVPGPGRHGTVLVRARS